VKNFTEKRALPSPTLERLAYLYSLLGRLEEAGVRRVTSRTLGELLSLPGHTVRKDLSILGGEGEAVCEGKNSGLSGGRGYDTAALRALVGGRLGLRAGFPVCLAGIGRLGGAILHMGEEDGRYPLAAAFEASVNRMELTRTKVPLYHCSQMSRVVREKNIVAGILAVPPQAAREVAERLVAGGVRGLVNFTPVIIPEAALSGAERPVVVRNLSLTGELDVIAAYLNEFVSNPGKPGAQGAGRPCVPD
jgi:redox-sensing transcriptional repressor